MHTIPTPMASIEPDLITDHAEFTEVPTEVMSQIASSPSPVLTTQLTASGGLGCRADTGRSQR